MDYKQAVISYQKTPTKQNLKKLTGKLCEQMTLKEKTKVLHGDYIPLVSRVIYGKLFKGTIFYLPFLGGGCKRLVIPKYKFSDGPKGAVTGRGTCFPSAMMRGASFDIELEYRIGTAIAKEAVAAGANFFGGICINLVRNPRGGRSQESYSEDPFLLGEMGSMLVKSVQAEGVIACPKHYALNSIENLRFLVSANADERTLREIYLHHFKKCIDAGALSIMAAYNKVNGEYCCENKKLLNDILRKEWGFDGFTMSDFLWGVHDAKDALIAGLDSEMPFPIHYNHVNIKKLIRKGELNVTLLDRAVRNILSVMIRLTPSIKPQPNSIMKCKEHLDLAEEAAAKGMVLLKNKDAVLPLSNKLKIAVVGAYADTVNVGDAGSSMVLCKYGITPYIGLSDKFSEVSVYNGLDPKKALRAAHTSDTVVVCVGNNAKDEGEFLIRFGDKIKRKPKIALGGDRDSLLLKSSHLKLLKTLKEAGKKVITVLYTGSVILTENLEKYSDAIIVGYYGGLRFGNALADLLSGDKNFSGKLPVSIAKQECDYPPFLEIGQKPYDIEYGYYNGYYLFDKENIKPFYPFGFGLSYTKFKISNIKVEKKNRGGISVSAMLKNIGDKYGAEVVQVYVGSAGADEHRPIKMLRGFKRAELQPGESYEVNIYIKEKDLKFYDTKTRKWVLDSKYNLYVGASSAEAAGNCIPLMYS